MKTSKQEGFCMLKMKKQRSLKIVTRELGYPVNVSKVAAALQRRVAVVTVMTLAP